MVTLCSQQLWSDTKVEQQAMLIFEDILLFESRISPREGGVTEHLQDIFYLKSEYLAGGGKQKLAESLNVAMESAMPKS